MPGGTERSYILKLKVFCVSVTFSYLQVCKNESKNKRLYKSNKKFGKKNHFRNDQTKLIRIKQSLKFIPSCACKTPAFQTPISNVLHSLLIQKFPIQRHMGNELQSYAHNGLS